MLRTLLLFHSAAFSAFLLLLAGRSDGSSLKDRLKRQNVDPFHEECGAEEANRQLCGRKTYSQQVCRARGCCWEPCEGCSAEIPWCFLAARMLVDDCQVEYEDKNDCGYYGISEGECIMRGCCWAPSHRVNDPPCFKKKNNILRLVNGSDEAKGRVEIRHDGVWGTICDDMFDNNEADVICRTLGYPFGRARTKAYFGEGKDPIWLDDLNCNGDERRLDECESVKWGRHNCGHSEDAGVECSNEPPPTDATDLRLVNGTGQSGRVEVFFDGAWGTVCDDNFDDNDATVICRQSGYRFGTARTRAYFGAGEGTIWLDELDCNGDEANINECSKPDWGINDCSHSEDAGVECSNEEIESSGDVEDEVFRLKPNSDKP